MRVGWLVYGTLAQATGGYVYDRCIVEQLRQRGCSVAVVSLEPGAPLGAVPWREWDVLVGDELCHPELTTLFAALGEARRHGERTPATLLLVHHLTAWELGRGASIGSEHALVRNADCVVTTSHTSAQRLRAETGVDARVCLPGADRLPLLPRERQRVSETVTATPLTMASSATRLLFVGTWTQRKGLDLLLSALDGLDGAWALTLVGDASREPDYARNCLLKINDSSQLRARTCVHGVVSDSELAALYACHDVLVLPSRFEGYGMVLTEAHRAGLAVIAADAGAVSEAVRGGIDALLVPPNAADALRAVLLRLLGEPGLLAALQQAAASRAVTTWSDSGKRFSTCLTGALHAARGQAVEPFDAVAHPSIRKPAAHD